MFVRSNDTLRLAFVTFVAYVILLVALALPSKFSPALYDESAPFSYRHDANGRRKPPWLPELGMPHA